MRDKQRIAEAIVARWKTLKAEVPTDHPHWEIFDTELYNLLDELGVAMGKTQQQIIAEANARAEEMRLKAAAESVPR